LKLTDAGLETVLVFDEGFELLDAPPCGAREAHELDSGDPADLAERYVALRRDLPGLDVVGGCYGTDIRHVTAICDALLATGTPG